MRVSIRRANFALAVAIAASTSGATAAERGILDYKVYFGGLAAVGLEIDLSRTADEYRILTKVRTLGLIDTFFPWTMRAYSRGRITARELRPEAAGQTSAWRGSERIMEVRYDGGRPTVARVVPTPDQDDREPVSDEDVRGTIDLATAILSLSLAAEAGRGCTGRIPVFDGRRRYDMIAERIGVEQVRRFGRAEYEPAALKCRVTVERISGFKKHSDHDESDTDQRSGTVWFAPSGAGLPHAPMRIEVDTPWGMIIAHLLRVRRVPAGAPQG